MNRNSTERRMKMKEILLRDGSVSSSDLANMFSVSAETIRKDLIYLEKIGFASKNYGGATLNSEVETPFELRNDKNVEAKKAIAARAIACIPEHGVILLDAGSTALLMARELMNHEGLTVITNSMSVANVLCASKNNVYITGGQVKSVTMSLVGLWASSCLSGVSIDVAFLGTSGFQNFSGPTAESFQEAELKKKILERSAYKVILADSSKCFSSAFAQYALWSEIDMVIMNTFAETERVKQIEQNTKLVFV